MTFGGAWSNHIYATAAAGKKFGFNTIGIIRGEEPKQLSATLEFAQANDMQLKFVTREQYRLKHSPSFIRSLRDELGDFYHIPEGGSNASAIEGVREIIDEIEIDFDVITCACGTGATLAGLISGLKNHQLAKGYAVLKGADFLNFDVADILTGSDSNPAASWTIETDYHFGGYAKISDELSDFIHRFKKDFGITLDGVYTGKMFYGLFDQIKQQKYTPGTTIIAIHTGGTQGNAGFTSLNNL